MKLDASDIADLRPLIGEAVRATIDQIQTANAKLGDKIGYTEAQAAQAMGLPQHVLGDARRRGEISARRVGKKYVYSRTALVEFLGADQ